MRRTVLVAHPGAELFGSDRMVLESVIGLREAGADVVVAIPEPGPLVPELTAAGARVLVVPMLVLRKSLLRPSGWPRLVRDLASGAVRGWRTLRRVRPDALYVSTITIPLWPLLGALARVRTSTHVHEAEGSGRRLVNLALYLPHLLSSAVIANSEFARRTIADALPRLARRSDVILNGVAGPSDPELPREDLQGELHLAYVGRLSPRKGPDLAIAAATAVAHEGIDVSLTLVGSAFAGYEWFEEELRDAAREARKDGVTVDLTGFTPSVWGSLARCDALLVPSRVDEPFGNTAVEGVLALRPVLASDTSGLREAAAGYPTTLMVAADDAGALAQGLRTLVRQWQPLRAQLEQSRAQARRRHSEEGYRRAVARVVLPVHDGAARS